MSWLMNSLRLHDETYYEAAEALGVKDMLKCDEASGNLVTDSGTYTFTVSGTPTYQVSTGLGEIVGIDTAADVTASCTTAGLAAGIGLNGANYSIVWAAHVDSAATGWSAMITHNDDVHSIYQDSAQKFNAWNVGGTGAAGLASEFTLNDDTWRLFAVVSESSVETRSYVNGARFNTGASDTAFMASDTLGVASEEIGDFKLDGGIGGILFFDKALTDDEVARLWKSVSSTRVENYKILLVVEDEMTQDSYDTLEQLQTYGHEIHCVDWNDTEITSGYDCVIVRDDIGSIGTKYRGDNMPVLHMENSAWNGNSWTAAVRSNNRADIYYQDNTVISWTGETVDTTVTHYTSTDFVYNESSASLPSSATGFIEATNGGDVVAFAIDAYQDILSSNVQKAKVVCLGIWGAIPEKYNTTLWNLMDDCINWLVQPEIFHRGTGTTTSTSAVGTTGITCNVPTNVVEGDLMILFSVRDDVDGATSSGSFNVPAGWTRESELDGDFLLGDDNQTLLCWKIAGASESNFTLTHTDTSSEEWAASIVAYAGVDRTNPIDVTPTSSHVSEVSDVATTNTDAHPAITTVTDNAVVVLFTFLSRDDVTSTAHPSGYTNRVYVTGTSHNQRQHMIWDKKVASAGTETPGAAAFTSSSSFQDGAFCTLALRPG